MWSPPTEPRVAARALFGLFAALALGIIPALSATPAPSSADRFHLKPGATGKVCLGCHADLAEAAALPVVHAPLKSGDCIACHNPHASSHGKLLDASGAALCARCHPTVAPAGAAHLHAPVAAGECARCHDPHASRNASLLRAVGNDTCASCHAAVAGHAAKAKFPHPPAAKNCLVCHDPHKGRSGEFLLKKEVPELCTGCHTTSATEFVKRHVGYPVAKARCTSCHDPHGSDQAGGLWAKVHPPAANRMCAQCHLDATGPNPTGLRKTGSELCRSCHGEVLRQISTRSHVHLPVADRVACLNCHAPHASAQDALLRQPAKQLCGGCHAATIARQETSKTKHPPVEEGMCGSCHEVHASDHRFLLNDANVMELCGACHEWKNHSTHPIGEKAVDPRNPNLTVDCLSCHRSHGATHQGLAHFDRDSELCVQCHQGVRR